MHIFLKEKNPRLWLLNRDSKILKNNEKNDWDKPSEPVELMTQDMILDN